MSPATAGRAQGLASVLNTDSGAAAALRSFLDEAAYAYVNERVFPNDFFPDFARAQKTIERLGPVYRLLLTLLRQGHAAEEGFVRQALPTHVVDALLATGVLVWNRRGHLQTPGLALTVTDGLYVATPLPPSYPTAVAVPPPAGVDPEALALKAALPGVLAGRRVIDLWAGCGLSSLVCAARGAKRVLAVEPDEDAAALARLNAALNGLAGVLEVRHAEVAELESDASFDLLVSCPPCQPFPSDVRAPVARAAGVDGMTALRSLFENLSRWLGESAQGIVFCSGLGDQFSIFFNRHVLEGIAERDGLFMRAHVDGKTPLAVFEEYLAGQLRGGCPGTPATDTAAVLEGWRADLQRRSLAPDFVYSQIVRLWKGRPERGLVHLPAYEPRQTDPLFQRVSRTSSTRG